MTPANRIAEPFPGIRTWSAFSTEHRVDLGSSAVLTPEGWWVFDPIPIAADASGPRFDRVVGIVLTNANHERDSARWCDRFGCQRWAAPDAEGIPDEVGRWTGSDPFWGWIMIPLPGGAPGEAAFLRPDRSLLVVGDALVNLPGRGLEVLPDKYCTDPARLRQSLRRLPSVDLILPAHGTPIPPAEFAALARTWDATGGA